MTYDTPLTLSNGDQVVRIRLVRARGEMGRMGLHVSIITHPKGRKSLDGVQYVLSSQAKHAAKQSGWRVLS